MKSITTKFLFWLISLTLLLSVFLLFFNHSIVNEHYREVMQRQASMALQFNLSIRKYAGDHIRPVMYDLLGEDEFIPETMSTSYIARSIFDDVRKQFPDYIIKFSSDNPRNPANKAGPEELKIIDIFNRNPELKRWEGVIAIGDQQYMAKFSARRMTESCLRCHGDPADAPVSLIERYGDKAGFHRPIGEVIGLDTVAIPLSKITKGLWAEALDNFFIIGGALLLFFLATAMTMRRLILNRVTKIAGHFQRAALQDDYSRIEPIPMEGRDEICQLAGGFNTLTGKLRTYYDSLENQVAVRTRALEEKNDELTLEIENRKKTEQALKESEATIRSIYQAAPTGIGMAINRIITQVNPRLCEMLGYSEDELVGKSTRVFYESDEAFESVGMENQRQMTTQGAATLETIWVRKNGESLHVLLSATPLDSERTDLGVTFVVLDYTDFIRAKEKERKLEERLARSQKMEALGLLAGGVAHDLNNVLSGIVSYPDLLLVDLPENSPLREPVETIKSSGKKASAIVDDLLTLARRGVANTEVLNLNDLIESCLNSPEWGKTLLYHEGIRIHTDLDDKLMNIRGSSIHLKKAILNLLVNAAEAIKLDGLIEISTINRYVDRPIVGYDQVNIGDYVVFTVADNGIGIEPDELKRIFEPFYTKKVMGRSGTGLGMSVVWGTIQDHNGYIQVESHKNKGTTFQLYFPVTRESLPNQTDVIPVATYSGTGQRILVVDDMEDQRKIATEMLTRLGYVTASASSGEEAVEILSEKSFDLIVLDMIMGPGMDGLDTYKMVRKQRPGQKAVIASGFSETDRVREAQQLGAGAYIKKPYTLEKLGLAVRDELEKTDFDAQAGEA